MFALNCMIQLNFRRNPGFLHSRHVRRNRQIIQKICSMRQLLTNRVVPAQNYFAKIGTFSQKICKLSQKFANFRKNRQIFAKSCQFFQKRANFRTKKIAKISKFSQKSANFRKIVRFSQKKSANFRKHL